MAYASRLYPRAEPRGFTLQRIKNLGHKKTPNSVWGFLNMVARPRIELGTHGFSIRCSTD